MSTSTPRPDSVQGLEPGALGPVRELARVVRHDLLSPLRKLTAFAGLLEEDLGPRLEGEDAINLRCMLQSAAELEARLQRLTLLGNVPASLTELRPLALAELLLAAREQRATADGSPDPSCAADVRLRGDRKWLVEMFCELFDNAAKYAPGAAVALTHEQRGRRLHLTLRDEGPGAPRAPLERLVQPFGRGVGASEVAGSGMGLPLASSVVSAHGGCFELQRDADGGLAIRFDLPA